MSTHSREANVLAATAPDCATSHIARHPHDAIADAIRGMQHNLLAPGCHTYGPCPRCNGSARGAGLCAKCHCADLGAIVGHNLAGELLTTFQRAQWQQQRAFAAVTA